MNHIRKFNESESKSKISEIEKYFLEAYQTGNSRYFLPRFHPDKFPEMASEFHVYDNFYLYDNNIYDYSRTPSGNWYITEIKLSELKPSDLIKELEEKLDKIEKAIEKLAYGHDV